MDNVIIAAFGGQRHTRTRPAWLIDHGMILKFAGLDLPQSYEVHFSNTKYTPAKRVIGGPNGVVIPDEYFHNAERIYAWLYLHSGENDGYTAYEAEIPLIARPETTNVQPTPRQEDIIEQAIDALNEAAEHYPMINDGYWYVWDAYEGDFVNTGVKAEGEDGRDGTNGRDGQNGADGAPGEDGEDGFSPVVTVEEITGGHRVTITDAQGDHVFDVMDCEGGGGSAVSPTVTVTDIAGGHRVTITDIDHPIGQSFNVMDGENGTDGINGTDGVDGKDGISPTISSSAITGGHRLTIVDAEGTTTVDVMDGQDGAPGQNGAPGADGQDGAPGQDGADGADGVSPEVTIASITGGHSVTITDADHPTGQTFNVMDGTDGTNGQDGAPGAGVASGGTTGQYLKKKSGTDYDTEWATLPSIPSSASDVGAEPAITEVTVSNAGAVTQALDAGKIYHFTGALTSLTITLNAAGAGRLAYYHFDFDCGAAAPTVTIPNTVTMPDSQTFDASTHYEVDILNNYGVVQSWSAS